KSGSIEQQGSSMLYKAKIFIEFDTKIGHPITTLTLAIGNQGEDNYKEFDIVKKDAVELFDPQASASDKKLERGMDERQYITVNLKGMKIDKSKSYIIRFVPSAKMDINKLDDEIDFGDTAGIEVLEAHFIDEKNIKLCLKIPDDELLGSYDLEIEEDNKDDDNPQNNPTT
ncbi:MAG: hypothetical protein KAQ92_07505, partial [Candidatus Aenigmarchaeota archaeon]|nr:hypothetical protein [Candidatus Aenigmarchaeota archaeon]